MGPQVTEDLVKACNTIIQEHGAPPPPPRLAKAVDVTRTGTMSGAELSRGMADGDGAFGYKLKNELKTMLGVCGKPEPKQKKKAKKKPKEETVELHDDDDL